MSEIFSCEVCNKSDLVSVLNLGQSPLCDDLIPITSSTVSATFPIEILLCLNCFTAHQRFQVPREKLFLPTYHYRARMTGSVLSGMRDLVNECEKRFGSLNGMKVLDIGCNDGSLLDFFSEKGAKVIGVEPTDAALESRHVTINKFFDTEAVGEVLTKIGKPDLITFTNVFAHIDNLELLLENLVSLIGPTTKIVIENHYLGAVLKYGQFDTFYHEHPRTYSAKSFKFIAEKLGLNVLDVEFVSRYGGNIRAYLGASEGAQHIAPEMDFESGFHIMASSLRKWLPETRKHLQNLAASNGPLPAKAFPGRASILINALELNVETIATVYEITGSQKVGNFVPGTRIPILPEKLLFDLTPQPKLIVNLAWHIPAEVQANLDRNGYTGEVLNLRSFEPIL